MRRSPIQRLANPGLSAGKGKAINHVVQAVYSLDGRQREMTKQPLTSVQRSHYDLIVSLHDQLGYFPTIREIMKAQGLASPSPVQNALAQLEQKGWIARAGGPYQPRAYQIVGHSTTNINHQYVLLPDPTIRGQDGYLRTDGCQTIMSEEDHAGRRIHHLARQFTVGSRIVGYWTPAHLLEKPC
jgi:hypothetical protein